MIAEEIRVESSETWPDYVFTKEYNLPTLKEVQKHIQEKGTCPTYPLQLRLKRMELNWAE